ncbi:MAG: metallophosphoesterase [Actinomycetota bacterium]
MGVEEHRPFKAVPARTARFAIAATISLVLLAVCTAAAGPTRASRAATQNSAARATVGPATVVAAGDIACPDPCAGTLQTSELVLSLAPDAVLTLGDNQYPDASVSRFAASYDPTWGRFKPITYPATGNHEYATQDAAGYFEYFGERANPPDGWYSFDLGAWHLVALNSRTGGMPAGRQIRWLERDLQRNPARCTLAYWHHPRWSSGEKHGSDADMDPFWQTAYREGVDVVLNGHEHHYERFTRLSLGGSKNRNGVRQFVVGSGGAETYPFDARALLTSESRIEARGVLELTLRAGRYAWSFHTTSGVVADTGETKCQDGGRSV